MPRLNGPTKCPDRREEKRSIYELFNFLTRPDRLSGNLPPEFFSKCHVFVESGGGWGKDSILLSGHAARSVLLHYLL